MRGSMVFYVLSYFLRKAATYFDKTFLCDMGLLCSTFNNSIQDRNIMCVILKR